MGASPAGRSWRPDGGLGCGAGGGSGGAGRSTISSRRGGAGGGGDGGLASPRLTGRGGGGGGDEAGGRAAAGRGAAGGAVGRSDSVRDGWVVTIIGELAASTGGRLNTPGSGRGGRLCRRRVPISASPGSISTYPRHRVQRNRCRLT